MHHQTRLNVYIKQINKKQNLGCGAGVARLRVGAACANERTAARGRLGGGMRVLVGPFWASIRLF